MAKSTAKVVDFSGVKDRGNFNPKQVAEGDYAATIVKVEDTQSKKDDEFMYVFTIKLDKFSQNSYPYYCKLTENQLWKLRNIAVAAGLNVPKKRMKFDPNKIMGKKIGVTMADDEHEGKMKSTIDSVFPMSELADGPDMEEDNSTDDGDFDEGAPQVAGADDDFDPEDEAESKPKKKKKAKAEAEADEPAADEAPKKKKKKDKKKKGSGENLEELDISDV